MPTGNYLATPSVRLWKSCVINLKIEQFSLGVLDFSLHPALNKRMQLSSLLLAQTLVLTSRQLICV